MGFVLYGREFRGRSTVEPHGPTVSTKNGRIEESKNRRPEDHASGWPDAGRFRPASRAGVEIRNTSTCTIAGCLYFGTQFPLEPRKARSGQPLFSRVNPMLLISFSPVGSCEIGRPRAA